MPTIGIDGEQLLEYNSQFRVLICRQCKYAIQKSATKSHLLRHKIYRNSRQSLLSKIARLDLLEPEQVPIPASTSRAIEFLPVVSGLRCVFVDCGRLCASLKRMRRHWSEDHDLAESPADPLGLSCQVKLQTFFRGTKIRYFEVESTGSVTSAGDIGPLRNSEEIQSRNHDAGAPDAIQTLGVVRWRPNIANTQVAQPGNIESLSPSRAPSNSSTASPPPGRSPLAIDLEVLSYFHHFITNTSVTLPHIAQQQNSVQQWQSRAVVLSLQHGRLMSGLLAISAAHKAYLTEKAAACQVHILKFKRFQADFCRDDAYNDGRDRLVERHDLKCGFNFWTAQVQRLISVLSLTLPRNPAARDHFAQPVIVDLQGLLRLLDDLTLSEFSADPDTMGGTIEIQEGGMVFQASTLLERNSTTGFENLESRTATNQSLQTTLEFIDQLAPRLSEAIGKPNDVRDVFATLAAIETLRDCCITGLAIDGAHAVWRGISDWWVEIPDHFRNLLSVHDPASLLVLTCWTGALLQRTANRRCWWLDGLAEIFYMEIANKLPSENSTVQGLFEDIKAFYARTEDDT